MQIKPKRTMKTLLTLTTALLFTAGSAFAQSNDATVDQIGNDNESTIGQTGTLNEAYIQQGGFGGGAVQSNNAEATIEQAGSMNDATINQRQGFSGGTAESIHSIDQDGTSNVATLTTFNGGNFGIITQEGDENEARGRQSVGSGNMIDALQVGSLNWIDVNQLSSTNGSVTITQNGSENVAAVNQTGSDNTVSIEQGVFGGAESSIAEFTQLGDGNYFETKQVRSVGNSVTGTQTGDDNYYRASLRGSDNTVTMDMEGDANRGSWSIGSLGWPHQPAGNSISIDVDGSDNYSTGSIAGDYNTVTVVQEGLGNRLGTSWYTTDGVSISGDLNTASVMQTSDFNTASVSIAGNSNTATITQN